MSLSPSTSTSQSLKLTLSTKASCLYQKDGRRVTWDTTWSDLLPDVAPPGLAEFYGPRSVDYCPEIDTSAAFVGVTYEPPKALKAAAKRARPMGLQLSASTRARR